MRDGEFVTLFGIGGLLVSLIALPGIGESQVPGISSPESNSSAPAAQAAPRCGINTARVNSSSGEMQQLAQEMEKKTQEVQSEMVQMTGNDQAKMDELASELMNARKDLLAKVEAKATHAAQLSEEQKAQAEALSEEEAEWAEELSQDVAARAEALAQEAAARTQELFAQEPGAFWRKDSGWLGIEITEVTQEKAKELKLPEVRGVIVREVVPESPAAKAGLEANDVILDYDAQKVEGTMQFRRLVRETPPGRTVPLEIMRRGHRQMLTVEVGNRGAARLHEMAPFRFDYKFAMPEFYFWPTPVLGISAENVSGQLGAFFGVPEGEGVLVREVRKDSAADKADLKAGDVITRVDGTAVKTVSELRRQLRERRKQKTITLTIVRRGAEMALPVTLEPPPSAHPAAIRSAAL